MVTKVTITELPDGWRLAWSDQDSEVHPTAVQALQAVKDRDQVMVNAGARMMVTTVEWEPRTAVGRAVVNVVAGVNHGGA